MVRRSGAKDCSRDSRWCSIFKAHRFNSFGAPWLTIPWRHEYRRSGSMGIQAVRITGAGARRTAWFAPVFAAMLPLSAFAGVLSDAVDDFVRIREQGSGSLQLDIDNDSLLFKRDDGFYTSGLRLV